VRSGARVVRTLALLAAAVASVVTRPATADAQPRVVVEVGTGVELASVSPRVVVRAFGFGSARPLRVTLRVSESFAVLPPFLVDTTFEMADSTQVVRLRRALPSQATVFARALVEAGAQAAISDIVGPRVVPPWLTLLDPASAQGNIVDTRQPLFVFRSPPVDTGPGPWRYDLEVLSNGVLALAASDLADTVYRPPSELQANTSYRWRVTARLVGDETRVTRDSPGSFVIIDPPLPTTTLLFQNFPNPFPSAASFSTCFWFDVGEPGARISLEVLDLRGTRVKTIVPAADGQVLFPPGRYGRGIPGLGNNCDNRFVWDGTDASGRPVPPGVYLARFRADDGRPTVRRIVFRGR
jgi:hypothetical protein